MDGLGMRAATCRTWCARSMQPRAATGSSADFCCYSTSDSGATRTLWFFSRTLRVELQRCRRKSALPQCEGQQTSLEPACPPAEDLAQPFVANLCPSRGRVELFGEAAVRQGMRCSRLVSSAALLVVSCWPALAEAGPRS